MYGPRFVAQDNAGSIRFRAALLTSVLIAVALVAVIAYTHLALRQTLIRAGEARATGVAAQLAGLFGPPIPVRLAEIQRLTDHASVRALLSAPTAESESAAFDRLKPITANAQQQQLLEVWDTKGRRVLTRRVPETGNAVQVSDIAPTPAESGVLPYRLQGDVVVSEVVVPIRLAGDGSPTIGYVVSRRVATNPNTPDTLNRLVGSGGRVLLGNQSGSVWTDLTRAVAAPPIDAAKAGAHRYVDADGETRLAGVAHLSGTPLAILIEFPQSLFIQPAWTVLRQLVIFGALFTLAATAVVWRLTGRITRPLATLTDAVRAVSGGDYSKRVPAGTDSEVGRLAAEFNAMAATIESALHELEVRAQRLREAARLEEENKRVQEASRMKSEFLANMSHELRTPLNAIIGFAELLYDGQVTPDMPEFRDFMHDILRSGQHLLQLINDVLDLSKVEAGRLEFHPEETALDQVVGETIGMLRPLAAQKQLTIGHEIDPSVEQVFVDRGRLKQVLYNYLSNAIKFTPESGRVWVRVAPEGDQHFRLEVIDTGVGIAAADLAKLFIEFNQLEAGAAKKHQGTGLGLALTRRLVEAQGGRVEVSSTPGRGSTFSAILPRRAVGGTPLAGPRSIPSARLGAPTVLVIEDDAADQAAIVAVLSGAGFNIETANTRAQAALQLEARVFDAITLDLILPDANGADVLKDIKASALNGGVPVVIITVVANGGAVTGFAVHDILSKPVDGDAVIRALERAGVKLTGAGSVLVVDDDPGSLRLMAASLQQLGYRSTCVARATEGLRISERDAPLAVVLDLLMPGLDGFGFLEHFRRIPSCQHVPVIVWTVKDLTPADLARLKQSVQGVMNKGQSGRSVVDELRRFVVGREVRS
jgi:signal transduction histidine kinase/DNA-binding response OmpR family regulator